MTNDIINYHEIFGPVTAFLKGPVSLMHMLTSHLILYRFSAKHRSPNPGSF